MRCFESPHPISSWNNGINSNYWNGERFDAQVLGGSCGCVCEHWQGRQTNQLPSLSPGKGHTFLTSLCGLSRTFTPHPQVDKVAPGHAQWPWLYHMCKKTPEQRSWTAGLAAQVVAGRLPLPPCTWSRHGGLVVECAAHSGQCDRKPPANLKAALQSPNHQEEQDQPYPGRC